MHEYAVTQSMVDIVIKEAEAAGASKVSEIRLVIGDLSTIIDESVGLYFDVISKGTVAEGAKLVFKRMPARFICPACGLEYDKPASGFECPACGATGRLTGAGREFYIESIEVDE